MANVWVYKECGLGQEVPIATMEAQLREIGVSPLSSEKRRLCGFVSAVCGAPTGQVNAFEISEKDAELLFTGIVGSLGFKLWTCDHGGAQHLAGGEVPFPWSALTGGRGKDPVPANTLLQAFARATSATSNPVLIRELVGYACRVYNQGDALTKDFRLDRFNVELGPDGRITDVWFG
jgi:hypothetical protein